MAIQTIYRMEWMRRGDVKCRLTITDVSQSTWDGVTVIDLTPSDQPFTTKEDSDTNPLLPIRTQTGTLSFVYTGNFSIDLKSSHQWRVVLLEIYNEGTDEETSNISFLGWLKAETYDQSLWEMNDEISFNVIDDLEAMKTWDLDESLDFEMTSIRSLMGECMAHINDHSQTVAFSNDFTTSSTATNVYGVLDYTVSRYNFFTANDTSDSEDEDQKDYDADSCYDLLEKVCTTFGWSLRIIGTRWLFSYPGSTTYTADITLTSFIALDTATGIGTTTPSELAQTDMTVCAKHTYSIEQGYRKVKIVSELNKVDDVVPALDIDDATTSWITSGTYEELKYQNVNKGTKEYGGYQKVRYLKPKSKNLVLHHLYNTKATSGSSNQVQEAYTTELETDVAESNTVNGSTYYYDHIGGAHAISLDYWDTPGDEGSKSDDDKINYSFNNRIIIVNAMPCYNGYGYRTAGLSTSNIPALHAVGDASAIYTNGGFEISFKMHTPCASVNAYPQGYYSVGHGYGPCMGGEADDDNYKPRVQCRFSVGGNYWNGTEWTTTASTFWIPLESQDEYSETDIITNKTLEMDFTAEQYVMPITSQLSGFIVFEIYKADSTPNARLREVVFMSDLSVKYCEPLDIVEVNSSSDDSHTYSRVNEGWTEDFSDVSLSIYSDNNDGASYGVITANNGPISQYYDLRSQQNRRPELSLLDKYQEHFSRSRTYYKLKLFNSADLFGANYITIQGTRFAILARTNMDWYSNEAEFLLESLT